MLNLFNKTTMKKLLFILMLCFTALATAGAQQTEKPCDKVYDIVEVMPQFPGGQGELMKFLRNNVKYPAEAQKKKIEGRVIVTFVVKRGVLLIQRWNVLRTRCSMLKHYGLSNACLNGSQERWMERL